MDGSIPPADDPPAGTFASPQALCVVILSGGKTGTTTLECSFRNSGVGEVHRQHFRTGALADAISRRLASGRAHDLLIVNAYREPCSRSVSSFFHNLEMHVRDAEAALKVKLNKDNPIDVRAAFDRLMSANPEHERYHPYDDLRAQGIFDTRAHRFDGERGWSLFRDPRGFHVLLLRFDLIPLWQNQIRTALRSSWFVIHPDNVSVRKPYSGMYADFKRADHVAPYRRRLMARDAELIAYFYPDGHPLRKAADDALAEDDGPAGGRDA